MATYRNVALTLTITAKSAKGAHKKASRITRLATIRKVHAYQIAQLADGQQYLVDIILKESITHKSTKRDSEPVGEVITSKVNCPHPHCKGDGGH